MFRASSGSGPDYVKRAGSSFFTLEAHVTYLQELHAGDRVRITTLDPRLRCEARPLCPGDVPCRRRLSRLREREHGHACGHEGQAVIAFPEEVFAAIAAMREAHRGLPVPREVGHRIGIPRKG